MALSDAEVEKQINHMKKFIKQEAHEKADEIMIKAEEEFNIEKGRLLQNEKRKVSNYFERREKQLELQKKIQHSNLLNQARLAVLKSRDDHIKRVLEEASTRLSEVTRDSAHYQQMLRDLVAQGLFQLLEEEVTVRCRQEDVGLVKNVAGDAIRSYEQATKKTCKVLIDTTHLPAECSGGVELFVRAGKIKCTNTLESRLELMGTQMMPEIRTGLYGVNPSRHFMD
ncbi:V-type proton ATPase subunit E 1 [Geodia barretti]|uniref:V-type proton ATPase subunit E 1 n=1 Tax=Geodia barretti TaxID=519541 RepID=A0AA35S7I8_GEOBA|nr:V-type proton ATPase subunit E 1 [Geodia barretti]